MPRANLRSLYVSLGLYLIVSPLATYNTFAMFGLVGAKFVPFQIGVTIVMICFAWFASAPISQHCGGHPHRTKRVLWIISFYVIGPPLLFAYYVFHIKRAKDLVPVVDIT
jgi:hypothetical protein